MAWEIVTKANVSSISGIKEASLQDWWYAAAVALVTRHANINNIGTLTSVTETKNGNGGSILLVNRPPISSVTSLYIDDVLVDPADYIYSGQYVTLLTENDLLSTSLPVQKELIFDQGIGNVVITYVSGSATIDNSVGLTIAFIVKELANLSTQEGADARLQFYQPAKSRASEEPLFEWGVHGKIMGIIKTFLGVKMKVA